jgi:hypothetical protein
MYLCSRLCCAPNPVEQALYLRFNSCRQWVRFAKRDARLLHSRNDSEVSVDVGQVVDTFYVPCILEEVVVLVPDAADALHELIILLIVLGAKRIHYYVGKLVLMQIYARRGRNVNTVAMLKGRLI